MLSLQVIHKKSKPYKCNHCDAEFAQPGDVRRHNQKVHQKELKNHPRTIATKNDLKATENRTLTFTFECEPCEAVFYTNAHFNRHNKKYHHTEQSFECDICKRILKCKNDLKRHVEAVHEKKKPYMCSR